MLRRQPNKCEMKERFLPILVYAAHVKRETMYYYPHKHQNLCEIVFIDSGEADFEIDGITYHVAAGNLIIYNQDSLHAEHYNPECPVEKYVLGMNRVFLYNRGENCIIPENRCPVISSPNYAETFRSYMKMIVNECIQMKTGYEQTCQGLLLSLFALVLREVKMLPDGYSQSEDSLVVQIRTYLEDNYVKSITLQGIAEHFYISSYYLAHLTKDAYGISPIKYITNLRLGEAQRLLSTTNYAISNIFSLVGYENLNYALNLFKKRIGVTPTQFRENSNIVLCQPETDKHQSVQ